MRLLGTVAIHVLENSLATEAPNVPSCCKKRAVESVNVAAALKLDAQLAVAKDGAAHDGRPVGGRRHNVVEQVVVSERKARVMQVITDVEAHARDVTPWNRT